MDSITQLALGAAVGEAVLGRKIGNRALAWGAVAGTLPDLDVFVPLGDAVRDFTYHRSVTHSLFVLALATPLLVWLITRIHADTRIYWRHWIAAIYGVFATHVLLDSLTAYGTQIFWPLSDTPVSLSTIFIIDPVYTLPLLVGVVAALVMTRQTPRGHRVNRYGLILSSLYLSWTLAAKVVVESRFEAALERQDIAYRAMFTTPAPFNSVLWRAVAVAVDGQGYFEGYYSLLDGGAEIDFKRYPSDETLLESIDGHWPVRRLRWFSKGIYSVRDLDGDIVISDLRMGIEPDYVFRFKVGEIGNPHPHPAAPEQLQAVRDFSRLPLLWERIQDPSVELQPVPEAGNQGRTLVE